MKRDIFTRSLDLGNELVVDNFAGGGGASTGIERALGRAIDIAINHDGEALAMHSANHPETAHYTEDVFAVHPGFITRQQPIALAWFSPDCCHHSKAKGGKPRDQKIRGLAWVTLKWAALQFPRRIALENVEEFQDWGPLDDEGRPIKAEKGRTFRAFVLALSTGLPEGHPDEQEIFETLGADFPFERLRAGLGYKVEWRVLRACDFGAPTIRKRLYLFARRDGLPIAWPSPSHGDPKSAAVRAGKQAPWRTAAECIDWSIPCPSIFERKRPLKDATLRRIARGIMKFVVNSADPFIVSYYSDDERFRGAQIDAPLGTTTTANRFAVVAPTLMHVTHHGGDRAAHLDVPLATVTGAHRGEQALVAAHITKFRANSVGSDIGAPLHTVTSGGDCARPAGAAHAMGVVAATLVQTGYGEREGQAPRVPGIDKPLGTVVAGGAKHALVSPTITAGGCHIGEVRAFLIAYYGNEKDGADLREPMRTIPTHDRFGLVTVNGEDYVIADIGMRMLTPRELARAQGFPDNYVLDPIVNGKPLSKSAQVRMIGNSVCPDVAEALTVANFAHERAMQQVAI